MKADELQEPMAEINVTPLVDVMLVLLVIFMVTAPLMHKGFNVTLPKATTGKRVGNVELVITLTKDHLIYLNEEMVTLKALRQKLVGMSNRPVFIRVDRSAYVSKLIELWDLCRDMGVSDIHVATATD